jgi:hypothetical protein
MRRFLISILPFLLPLSCPAQQSRHITFHYAFTIRNVPQGQKVESEVDGQKWEQVLDNFSFTDATTRTAATAGR